MVLLVGIWEYFHRPSGPSSTKPSGICDWGASLQAPKGSLKRPSWMRKPSFTATPGKRPATWNLTAWTGRRYSSETNPMNHKDSSCGPLPEQLFHNVTPAKLFQPPVPSHVVLLVLVTVVRLVVVRVVVPDRLSVRNPFSGSPRRTSGLQVPPQKVFGPPKPTPNTFLEGTWSPRRMWDPRFFPAEHEQHRQLTVRETVSNGP